ncbi:50S ribosomal protein L4 [candidate division Kazan bacterium RIFCSPHIGHO2_01_FULL_49_10]|uniref:Large ribosomal subunit protein uL4 n=1 Tax=candidate division Kazan bacterium RIFCSPLOWO2_01_FULL_48_13 TaxID=1798539 RepID=A0A1F4PPS3_UNCK3|nr:MAG: 50S ribosomal protein L4 [candidate division Kazan bacterium RIFCSPHIGHO2_01_FULL_49_10]OGB85658.1 MAG: 50S ribosomal protein L4 [candidate division Kazan bacterium RIFCSPLOWO2_01_FULL_48_13]
MVKTTPKTSAKKTTVISAEHSIKPISEHSFTNSEMSLRTLSQVLIGQQSNQRRATAHIKHRGEVAGTTKKPWRQKGTGRARVGTRRNPVWRGGGAVFGPTNQRNFSKKINRELLLPALVAVLSSKAKRGELFEVATLPRDGMNKTKAWLALLSGVLDSHSNLLVAANHQPAVRLAVKNLSYVQVVSAKQLSALSAAAARRIIFLPGALTVLQERA